MQLEKATVVELHETTVTLSIRDAHVTIAKDALFGIPKVGGEIRLAGFMIGAEDAGRTELARTLLNELIGVQHPPHA